MPYHLLTRFSTAGLIVLAASFLSIPIAAYGLEGPAQAVVPALLSVAFFHIIMVTSPYADGVLLRKIRHWRLINLIAPE
jgi:hypothetical protein